MVVMSSRNNCRATQPVLATESFGWRTKLRAICRERVVNMILHAFTNHLPFSCGQEGKLKDLVAKLEEKIYAEATSQSDYLRQISSNFWEVDTNSHNTMGANSPYSGYLRVVVIDANYWRDAEAQAHAQAQVQILVQGMAEAASVEDGDWRAQLTSDSRDKIVNIIVDTLRRGVPFFGQEGLNKLKRSAIWVEEKIYDGASSQTDYTLQSYLRIKSIGIKMQERMANPLQPNGASVSTNEANINTGDELSSPNEKDLEENLVYRRGKRARKTCAKFDDFVMG